jgi:hypothetical protein
MLIYDNMTYALNECKCTLILPVIMRIEMENALFSSAYFKKLENKKV